MIAGAFMRAPFFAGVIALCVLALPAWAQAPACPTPAAIAGTHEAPPYPREAETRGEEGTTILAVTVGADGGVAKAMIAKPSGSERLDDAAMSWVNARFRWQPAPPGCGPAAAPLPVRIVWRNPYKGAPTVMAEGPVPPAWSADASRGGVAAIGYVLPCTISDIKTVIHLDAAQPRTSTPVLGIALTNANGPGQLYGPETVLLRLAYFENSNGVGIYMRKDGGRQQSYDLQFPNKVGFGQDIPIEFSWNTDGQINVTVDWKKTSIAMSVVPAQLTFYVSGGKGEVKNIQASWQGRRDPPAGCEKSP
jgi:TonB family protein